MPSFARLDSPGRLPLFGLCREQEFSLGEGTG